MPPPAHLIHWSWALGSSEELPCVTHGGGMQHSSEEIQDARPWKKERPARAVGTDRGHPDGKDRPKAAKEKGIEVDTYSAS